MFDAPALSDLDPAGREAVAAACRVRDLAPGQTVFSAGDPGDSFFVVLAGAVELRAAGPGDDAAGVVRIARRGDTFGEEVTLPGLARRVTAAAADAARVAEIPIAVFLRATGRPGAGQAVDRERRFLERAATRDLLAQLALARDLDGRDLDVLVDAARLVRFERGERIYAAGDRADAALLVVDGLVQLQAERDGRPSVRAYLTRGDVLGDAEALAGGARPLSAVATGDTACLRVPAAALRLVADRNPGLLDRLRRVAEQRDVRQADILAGADARATQHVLRDLYRMQMARSLLVIDQDTCVRCGHCAWSCAEVHGVSRLIRRGDKIETAEHGAARVVGATSDTSGNAPPVATPAASVVGARSLLLPSSCQHCRNPACMIDCPTGAIGRDPEGEVYIRAELCTGCGKCARACPWDNIQLAPRAHGTGMPSQAPGAQAPDAGAANRAPAGRALPLSAQVAVKCDLCRDWEAPACVQACPTGSLIRIDPGRDIAEVAAVLGMSASRTSAGADAAPARGLARASAALPAAGIGAALPATGVALALPLAALGWALHAAGRWTPGRGAGLAAGVAAGALVLALAGHAVPKRVVGLWMRRRVRAGAGEAARDRAGRAAPAPRSRTAPLLALHLGLGALAIAAVIAHAGGRPLSGAGAGNAPALLAWWSLGLVCAVGAVGAAAYRWLPRRLARLETRGALPEDLAGEREALLSRLYRELSGRTDVVKALAERVLLPYATRTLGRTLGPLALVASGRDVRAERRRLRARVDAVLAGRGSDKLDGLDDIIRTVVELRALPARRWLTRALRAWLPAHLVATGIALSALVVHAVLAAVTLGGGGP